MVRSSENALKLLILIILIFNRLRYLLSLTNVSKLQSHNNVTEAFPENQKFKHANSLRTTMRDFMQFWYMNYWFIHLDSIDLCVRIVWWLPHNLVSKLLKGSDKIYRPILSIPVQAILNERYSRVNAITKKRQERLSFFCQ